MIREFDRIFYAGFSSDAPRIKQLTSYSNYDPLKLKRDFEQLATIAIHSSEQAYKLYKQMSKAGMPTANDRDLVEMLIDTDDVKLDVVYLLHLIDKVKANPPKDWMASLKTQAYVSYLTAPQAYAKVMGSRIPVELTRRPTFEHWPTFHKPKSR